MRKEILFENNNFTAILNDDSSITVSVFKDYHYQDEVTINNVSKEDIVKLLELISEVHFPENKQPNSLVITKLIIKDIKWEYDSEEDEEEYAPDLPTEVEIDITKNNTWLLDEITGDAEAISDYLSELYGFCHKGFNIIPVCGNK